MQGFTPVLDETGQITGYKTSIGGADTVFPFSGKKKIYLYNNGDQCIDITGGYRAFNPMNTNKITQNSNYGFAEDYMYVNATDSTGVALVPNNAIDFSGYDMCIIRGDYYGSGITVAIYSTYPVNYNSAKYISITPDFSGNSYTNIYIIIPINGANSGYPSIATGVNATKKFVVREIYLV